ncbi:MAG: PRC-barrel domain-containing protein [Anoxybacillus sp.]|nr:PRC-barrel domain-containing protein [Anoxybacillus sp.]MCL6585629.1 PRC-barrel domain-containing protein [Anoxybacillus sp.]
MKRSAQMVGLPIISISDGVQIGTVKTLVINPEKGSVDFLTIEQEDVQFSLKAIPFKKVVGIGEFAVTVDDHSAVIDLAEIPIANQLVNKQIRIKNTKAMTRKGQLLGEVTEFFVDEETGEIIGVELTTSDRQAALPAEFVLTYGKDILIVNENAASALVEEVELLGKNESLDEVLATTEKTVEIPAVKENDALQALREKQIEILQGKRVMKDIVDGNGNVLIAAGTILTVDDIVKAQEAGPSVIIDVSMNVDA